MILKTRSEVRAFVKFVFEERALPAPRVLFLENSESAWAIYDVALVAIRVHGLPIEDSAVGHEIDHCFREMLAVLQRHEEESTTLVGRAIARAAQRDRKQRKVVKRGR